MKRLWLLLFALAVLWGAPNVASAQQALKVTTCGTAAPPAGLGPVYIDALGLLCVNATVSASVAVAPLTSSNLSSTVAVTNTFQSIQVATAGRNGCNIQNTSTHTQWVYFGAIAGATAAKGFQLAAGQTISCSVGGLGVLTDQVSITGTATDTFVANFQ